MDFNLFQGNSQPIADFEGFSPNDMHGLLHNPFSKEQSLFRINPLISDELLLKIRMFNDIIRYLDMLKDCQPLKLTPKGNLPRNFCRELYDTGVKDEELLKMSAHPIRVELDSLYIHVINMFTKMLGLTKKRHNKISLTKKANDRLNQQNAFRFFHDVFSAYTQEFNWAYSDGHPQSWIVQAGFCFSMFLVQKYGDELRPIDFYSEKYLRAFPTAINDFKEKSYCSMEDSFKNTYGLRVFQRFLKRFGFVEISGNKYASEGLSVRKTPLIDQVFTWKVLR